MTNNQPTRQWNPYCSEPEFIKALSEIQDLHFVQSHPNAQNSRQPDISFSQLGDYKVLHQIGQGGIGTVYKAIHRELDKVVAIKRLSRQAASGSELDERFACEIRAIGKLDHANILRATDARTIDDVRYLITEYVEGVDLATLVKASGPLSVSVACEMIQQAADGLQHVHGQGIIHRDVKPQNLMLSQHGVVKILDLGLARLTNLASGDSITSDNIIVGTLDYIAPEQLSNENQLDARADVYALGCTFYFLLAGHAPFHHIHEPFAKILAHRESTIDLTQLNTDLPEKIKHVLGSMLQRNPLERIATAGEVSDLLTGLTAPTKWNRFLNDVVADVVAREVSSHTPNRNEVETDAVKLQTRPNRVNKLAESTDVTDANTEKELAPRKWSWPLVLGFLTVLVVSGMVLTMNTGTGTLDTGEYKLDQAGRYVMSVVDPSTGSEIYVGNSFEVSKGQQTRIKISTKQPPTPLTQTPSNHSPSSHEL
ncbi:serine/threonine protein kinase with PASTA sensor(s), partial [Rhodopirellula maiorica SM1]